MVILLNYLHLAQNLNTDYCLLFAVTLTRFPSGNVLLISAAHLYWTRCEGVTNRIMTTCCSASKNSSKSHSTSSSGLSGLLLLLVACLGVVFAKMTRLRSLTVGSLLRRSSPFISGGYAATSLAGAAEAAATGWSW